MATLSSLFDPKNVALIGASDREGSVGQVILANLLNSKNRNIYPVNNHKKTLLGRECYPGIDSIPGRADMAVIATPIREVPSIMDECGRAGVGSAVIISSGFKETQSERMFLEGEMTRIRKQYGMRVVGPDSLGFVRPNAQFNTTFLENSPPPGNIAFISQSGALGSAILDWAADAQVGFSMFASLGSMIDVGFGDLIDFLGDDWDTRSILIYMQEVGNARAFISAARAFALRKPIIILRQGKFDFSPNAALYRTGPTVEDAIYEAAFRRAGVVWVRTIADLFHAASVLDSKKPPRGPRLAIITAASQEFAHAGPGSMAIDALTDPGGELAQFSQTTIETLNEILPDYCNKTNPVHVPGSDGARYEKVIGACLKDTGVDGVLVIYIPMNVPKSDNIARAVIESAKKSWKPVITAWMGGKQARSARDLLVQADVPTYETPEEAVETYVNLYKYKRNLDLLYETPSEVPEHKAPQRRALKDIIKKTVFLEGRKVLTEKESKEFLQSYGIPSTIPRLTRNVEEALKAAKEISYPVVLKIVSPQILRKSEVGGVITGISTEGHLQESYRQILREVGNHAPHADIEGITVQKMLEVVDYGLLLRARRHKDFGAVILFGMGGITREIIRDFSVGFPPLNRTLARRLIEDTRAYRLIHGCTGRIPVRIESLEEILVAFSNLIVDFPEIREIDIDPLAISAGKPCALDARMTIDTEPSDYTSPYRHLVITPYPSSLTTECTLSDGTKLVLRPIKPEDEPLEHQLLSTLSEETLRARFLSFFSITHERLVFFCNIDYDRQLAIVAVTEEEGIQRMVGVGRLLIDNDKNLAEYALLVHDSYQGRGLGSKLMETLIAAAKKKGLDLVRGEVLSENKKMLGLAAKHGFSKKWLPEAGVVGTTLELK